MNTKTTNTTSITWSILTAGFAAVATAALLLAAAWPGLLDAKDPVPPKAPLALTALMSPAVTIQGCKLTIVAPKTPAGAAAGGIVQIKAVNTGEGPVSFEAVLTAMSQAPGSQFSRRMVLPTPSWQDNFQVALGPKEEKTFELAVPASVLDGKQLVTFRVTEAGKAPKIRDVKAALRLPAAAKPARSVR